MTIEKDEGARPEPKADEARLHETTTFLDSIVENIPHMIFVKEATGLRFTRINRAGEALLGTTRAELLGRGDFDLFPSEQAEAFQAKDREVLRGRAALDVAEEPILTPRGQRWLHTKKIPLLDAEGRPAFLLGISEDITLQREMADAVRRAHEDLELRVQERTAELTRANLDLQREIHEREQAEAALRASEEQLRQAQKLDAIGRLAGGVAHDFNNLLSVILGYAQVMAGELASDDPKRAYVQEIHTAGLRASELTRQLLAFARKQVLLPRVLDLNEVVSDMARMLKRIIGEDIDLRLQPAADLDLTRLDPHQVEQIVMNLVVNARDAMPRGGKLTIETRNVVVGEEFAREHLGVDAGPYVVLAVTDTGQGMDATTKARIFEPFFTTKDLGVGTGLGLSTVFGIVQQSGGSIWVYSELGHGTTFKVYFPATIEKAQVPTAAVTTGGGRGSETVLLVEDEPQVRVLLRRLLEREGYTVLVAENAAEAVGVSDSFGEKIDVLLTDVVMPKTSGTELASDLSAKRPDMRVLFMSGYTDNAMVHHGVFPEGAEFLQKPVVVDSLTRKLRDVLDGPSSRGPRS